LGNVAVNIANSRPAQPRGDVVPPQATARGMLGRVVAIAAEICQVDATDKGDVAVDHD
jgi:hypothetical protein